MRIPPALALLLLAPALGELVSGHQAPLEFINPVAFAALALPYGCGALLCREFARRWRGGWPSLLCLAAAYALYEEGIVSRALFDPHWRESGPLAAFDHAAGVNWTYGFVLVHFHVAISIGASVLLAELLFPERRNQPWLGNRQAALSGLVLLLWAPALAALARADDPLYTPHPALWILTLIAILGLAVAARVARPPVVAPAPGGPPRARAFFLLGAVNMTVVFTTVFILPENGVVLPLPASVPLLVIADGVTLLLLLRWSGGGSTWHDGQRVALAAGLVAFFMVAGVLGDLERFQGRSLVSLGAAVGLLWLRSRVAARTRHRPTPGPASG
jgi:hypothetical protein